MPRPRKQKPQPPLRIEINFDADLEGLLFDPETADARHLKVTIQDRKLRPKTLKLLPPAEGELNRVSPVRLRAGTDVYPPAGNAGVVEFRAELDVDAIEAHWGEVEGGAASPSGLPFRFSVGIEKQRDSDPDPMERSGLLTINLNSIHLDLAAAHPRRERRLKGKTDRPSRWTRPSRCPWTAPTRMDSSSGWSFKSGRRTANTRLGRRTSPITSHRITRWTLTCWP